MFRLCLAVLMVSGCAAPSSHFRGVPVRQVTVDSSIFDIRHRGNLAEAVRRNAEYAPRLGSIGDRAVRAMQVASGCSVARVLGDAAVVLGVLDCGTRAVPVVPTNAYAYECEWFGEYDQPRLVCEGI